MSTLTELINHTSTSVPHSPAKKLDIFPSEIKENYYLKGHTTSSIGKVISTKGRYKHVLYFVYALQSTLNAFSTQTFIKVYRKKDLLRISIILLQV